MRENDFLTSLPPGYNENTLLLLVQSPRVLYAYWELSGGLKDALRRQEKRMLIRLYIEGQGICSTRSIDLAENNIYFSDVKPGLTYYCEIGTFNSGDRFYPLLRSDLVTAPYDRPLGNHYLAKDGSHKMPSSMYLSSWAQYKEKE